MNNSLTLSHSLPSLAVVPTSSNEQKNRDAKRRLPPRDRGAFEVKVRWVEDFAEMQKLKTQWQALEINAMQRSICHEFNYLMPALHHLAPDGVKLLIVEAVHSETPKLDRELIGLMPIEFKRIAGLPMPGAQIWKHDQAFDTTPLLNRDLAVEAWQSACEFLAKEKISLFGMSAVSAEPPFESVLRQVQEKLQLSRFQRDSFQRAGLRPVESAEEYMELYFSKNTRKKLKRAKRQLAACGDVTWERHSTTGDWESLAEQFLQLEGSGWKGENGTALNSDPKTESFFRELVRESAAQGKVRFLTLRLDGEAIAMLCDIQSGPAVYSYKTGFNENFQKFSPGKLCEAKNIEYLHDGSVEIDDSCTVPESRSFGSLWAQKLDFQNVVFSLTPGMASHAVKGLPAAQQVVAKIRSFKKQKPQEEAVVQSRKITVSVVETVEGFKALKGAWDKFNTDPMNGFDWNFAWWQSFASTGQLHILKFERAGSIIGIAPLYVDRWYALERLRFIGSGKTCTEYVDVVTRSEDRDLIDDVLIKYLAERKFSVVELECTQHDRLANRISSQLRRQYSCDNRLVEPSWGLRLPESWDEFVASANKSLRRKIRKAMKRIESGEVRFASTADGASVDACFDALRDLHQERFHSKNMPGAFADDRFEAFLRDAAQRLCAQQQAEIIVLYKDDQPIGAQVYLNSEQGPQFYQSGYATSGMKLEPGHIIFTETVRRSIGRGDRYFDFLRGDEPYKAFWGGKPVPLRKQRLVSKAWLPSLISCGISMSRETVNFVSNRLKKN